MSAPGTSSRHRRAPSERAALGHRARHAEGALRLLRRRRDALRRVAATPELDEDITRLGGELQDTRRRLAA